MKIILLQLPVPKLNFNVKTGNIPLGAACLKQAASGLPDIEISILKESLISYLGDYAIVDLLSEIKPDIIGFSVFSWNLERSHYLAEKIKERFSPTIVFGGPEMTPDNRLAPGPFVDHIIYGEGENQFVSLLSRLQKKTASIVKPARPYCFETAPSPYLSIDLEPDLEKIMLLETQRGCPFKCGFCFYNKAKDRVLFKDEDRVLEGLRWAVENEIEEVYILDPTMNIRPGLKDLLQKMADINSRGQVSLNSEIRTESIDREMADLFQKAGFTWFEIGLQSTGKKALELMNRPTRLDRFLTGAKYLQDRDIILRTDLIVGLPGDDLDGFSGSIGFVSENDLDEDVQVFPLSILPGTEFRENREAYGLVHEPVPPYTVTETSSYSRQDMLLSFDYAETLFNVNLFPFPHLDIAWMKPKAQKTVEKDIATEIENQRYISKIIIDSYRSEENIEAASKRLTLPYQIFVKSEVSDEKYIFNILNIISKNNPHTPFEIIFIDPKTVPDLSRCLVHCQLKRPHYLDMDLRYLFDREGNRAVLFTIVSASMQQGVDIDMSRNIYHWTSPVMPSEEDLNRLIDFDGILINNNQKDEAINKWQDSFYSEADTILPVSFAQIDHQQNWLKLTASDEFCI